MQVIQPKDLEHIRDVACGAHDALEGIMFEKNITPSYLANMLAVVKRGIRYLEQFAEEEENE